MEGIILYLAVGVTMILGGLIMICFPPQDINALYGYRTSSSMKNQENWDLAQATSSKLMICWGIVLIVGGVTKYFLSIGSNTLTFWGVFIPLFTIMFPIFITEKRLRDDIKLKKKDRNEVFK